MKDVIVRIKTKEDWERVVAMAIKNGCFWYFDNKDTYREAWRRYKEETCIQIKNNVLIFSPEDFFRKEYPNIPIISAQEFLEPEMGEYIGEFEEEYKCPSDMSIVLDFMDNHITGSDETISQPNKTMNKLNPMMKRLLDKDTRTLYKAGYINRDLELTENGRNALDTILFTANKAELVKMAQEELDEEE